MKPERLIFPELSFPIETLHHHKNRYEFVKQFLKKQDVVFDLGCGTGYGSNILSTASDNVYGFDNSREAIEYARKTYKGPSFIYKDLNDIVVPCVDVVVLFECLEHLGPIDGYSLIRKISPNTNYLFISVPKDSEIGSNPHHKSQWSVEELHNRLEDHFDRLLFFGQDWASGVIHYPFSKQHSITMVVCINE